MLSLTLSQGEIQRPSWRAPSLRHLLLFFATQIDQPQIIWSPRARQRTVFALCFTTSHNIISRRRQKDKTNLTGGLVSSLEGGQVQHHCPFWRHKGLFSGAAYFSKESSEKWSKLNPFSCLLFCRISHAIRLQVWFPEPGLSCVHVVTVSLLSGYISFISQSRKMCIRLTGNSNLALSVNWGVNGPVTNLPVYF